MHDGLTIGRGFADDERDGVAALYWEAFGQKLRPGFFDEQTGIAAVRCGLQPEHMLAARRNGTLLGVCGFYGDESGAVDLTWSRLRGTLSIPATLRASIVLAVLSRSARPHTLVLDGICVDRTARGLGIGTALLHAAKRHARSEGNRSLQLSVVDGNPRARALYDRQGFRPVGGGSLGLLSFVYGFDHYTTMELEIV